MKSRRLTDEQILAIVQAVTGSALAGQVGVVTRNPGWYGRLVQWFTRSQAYHTITAVSDTECVSAETPRVVLRQISDFVGVEWTDETFSTPVLRRESVRFVLRQVGKPYAYFDIVLLVLAKLLKEDTPEPIKERLEDHSQWYCSELADAGLEAGEVNLFPDRPPSAVIPKDFDQIVHREAQAEAA